MPVRYVVDAVTGETWEVVDTAMGPFRRMPNGNLIPYVPTPTLPAPPPPLALEAKIGEMTESQFVTFFRARVLGLNLAEPPLTAGELRDRGPDFAAQYDAPPFPALLRIAAAEYEVPYEQRRKYYRRW